MCERIHTHTYTQAGRLRRLESLALLPDEVRFGEGEDGQGEAVAVADMVWVATDAFRCVISFLLPLEGVILFCWLPLVFLLPLEGVILFCWLPLVFLLPLEGVILFCWLPLVVC